MISPRLEDMTEENGNLELQSEQAKALEKAYDWIGAATIYEKMVVTTSKSDYSRLGELSERIANSLHHYAFQCSNHDEFVRRINGAITAYGDAREKYSKLPQGKVEPYVLRCDAMSALEEYWRAPSVAEKKQHVARAWDLAVKSTKGFMNLGEFRQAADTQLQLGFSGYMTHAYSWDFEQRKAIIKEAMDAVETTVHHLADDKDKDLIARLLLNLSSITWFWSVSYADRSRESAKYSKMSKDLFDKAIRLSEESAICQMALPDAWCRFPVDSTIEVAFLEKALGIARKSGDAFSLGSALNELAVQTWWIVADSGTMEDQRQTVDKSIGLAKEACDVYSKISYRTPNWNGILWIEAPEAAKHGWVASWEGDVSKRSEFGLKGLEHTSRMIELAKECEYPEVISLAYWAHGICQFGAAVGETNEDRKRKMIQRAIESYNESISVEETIDPGMLWDRGYSVCELARASRELSLLTKNASRREKEMLAAVDGMGRGIDMMENSISTVFSDLDRAVSLILGRVRSELGDYCQELYGIDNQEGSLQRSREAYLGASRHHEHGGFYSCVAEDCWNAAKISDSLGDHSGASDLFRQASRNYSKAIEKIPRLRQMYEDHAKYMSAWSEIELARQAHSRQEYGKANAHYEKAAELHESTTKWRHLASNYKAWAAIEDGEDLSRREKCREAIELFHNSESLFSVTKSSLEDYRKKIESQDELQSINRLIKAADLRREYSSGRVALEEAKILDRQGDEFESCERFGSAEATFRRIRSDFESSQDKREIGLIMTLAKAWQTMAKAESETSPELYEEASRLFEESKELSVGETAKLLALGHSKFCKALAAGTKFGESGDPDLHTLATQSLESAAKSYLKAGLEKDAEYANASKLLFDAYVYMDKAAKEEDNTKKAKLYAMTEKVLEASADAFTKADYPKKKEQVMKLHKKVKQDRELAVSLMEIFHAPDAVSSTTAFAVPAATQETANGVEEFRHASIQATLVVRSKEVHVGDDLRVEVEIVNAGGAPAQIMKIERAAPEGFELSAESGPYRADGNYLNMRGKKLDALKTEDVTLNLKPSSQGRFSLNPRIMYLDDTGKYKICEPEPIEVFVKELGVAGWLRGPESKKRPRA